MRLIDADKLLDVVESLDWYHLNINGEMVHGANSDDHQPYYISDDIYEAIRNAPTVEAAPVVHGSWERIHMWTGAETIFCSVCGEDCYVSDTGDDILSDYCPHCGARMDDND